MVKYAFILIYNLFFLNKIMCIKINYINFTIKDTIMDWFFKLGYDKDFYPIRSRTFMLTIHSEEKLSVIVKDNTLTDFDNNINV